MPRPSGPGRPETFWSLKGSPALILRTVLSGLVVSTCVGVWFGTAHRYELVRAFPGASNPVVYAGLLLDAGVGLVGVAGLWLWRRWGIALYALGGTAGVVLDVLAEAPTAHQVTVVVSTTLVLVLSFANRARFAR